MLRRSRRSRISRRSRRPQGHRRGAPARRGRPPSAAPGRRIWPREEEMEAAGKAREKPPGRTAEHPYPRPPVGPTARSSVRAENRRATSSCAGSPEPGTASLFSPRANPAQETCCSTIAHIRSCWSCLHPTQSVKSTPASVWTDSSKPEEQECDTHERSLEKKVRFPHGHQVVVKKTPLKSLLLPLNAPPEQSFCGKK